MLDPVLSRVLGLSLKWASSILEAPDHARAKIAARRYVKVLEYIIQNGDVPPEDWQPDVPVYMESHHYGIAGPGVEVETWKGLAP